MAANPFSGFQGPISKTAFKQSTVFTLDALLSPPIIYAERGLLFVGLSFLQMLCTSKTASILISYLPYRTAPCAGLDVASPHNRMFQSSSLITPPEFSFRSGDNLHRVITFYPVVIDNMAKIPTHGAMNGCQSNRVGIGCPTPR